MREEEVERHRVRISRAPQVMRDREYPVSADVIVDTSGSVDVSFPVLAKVSAAIEALRLSEGYELVHQLWSQCNLVAGQVNVGVTWLRDEVFVSALFWPYCTYSSCLFFVVLLLVNHPEGPVSRILSKGFS